MLLFLQNTKLSMCQESYAVVSAEYETVRVSGILCCCFCRIQNCPCVRNLMLLFLQNTKLSL